MMNKQQVETAVGAGLELLGDKSDVVIPTALNDGIFFLKQLLMLIASGQLGLRPTVQKPPPGLPDPPPLASDKKKRAAVRAVARKKKKKKKKKKRTVKNPPKNKKR